MNHMDDCVCGYVINGGAQRAGHLCFVLKLRRCARKYYT